ncbi:TRAP transporter substrate-binding protein [Pseudorhodoferax sp. Leaf265]|jgi:tripartite ATP-independent transporter DctP family solute receptor|uniref:TRAP transporter substrate-binding protein n=1 Tax=Pseudorhodoferax sp. Leaf265 TaxID=1736315 RepID=UPI0006F666CC|nr:TRAP transporter substrate-binding protein [Pseudorhodoferax sp. Leaf265]KQP20881.1 C4-dicarboxylate ABC transporter [Pseudorhodoferax sp. Leaf265]PZP93803.1 MAG: TRAP transporter substrate-binding protein [Variovorax paradoxus]PZQ04352.1 MAG: TRAP transporter substrate-binding protein [Variovorax paradoxus]
MTRTKTLLALAASAFALSAQAVEFRSADVHNSDDYPTVAAVKHMSQVLAKESGGKYTIKVFNKSALGSEKETLDQVKIGALEMNRVNISSLNSICPKTLVPTMPFLFDSIPHMRKVLDGPVGEEILKGCESQGLVGLAFYDSGARSIYAKKPVKTLADAKGLKIRVQQSDLWVALVGAMGANATPMPTGEVYTALKTGLIDAAENNIPSYEGFKHYEAVKFYSHTEHSMAPEMLVISKAIFDKMSPADQALFRKAAKESVTFQRQKWDEQEAKALDIVVKAGSTIVKDVDKASFKAAMQPVYAKFINTPDLQRLVKAVQDTK